MHSELKQNFEEKHRLAVQESVLSLEKKFKAMLALHSAEGRLSSGDTIKKTMGFIVEESLLIYEVTIDHLKALEIDFHQDLEVEIVELADAAQESYKAVAYNSSFGVQN